MKVTLTTKEIKAIISARYNLTETFTLEIVEESLTEEVKKIEQLARDGNKIAAIKALRTLSQNALGLADAKYGVENIGAVLEFVRDYNALPKTISDKGLCTSFY